MNKINIKNNQEVPQENVLDLREIYKAKQKVQEKQIEEKVVKKEEKKPRKPLFKLSWSKKPKEKIKEIKEEVKEERVEYEESISWFKGLVKPLSGLALI